MQEMPQFMGHILPQAYVSQMTAMAPNHEINAPP